MIKSTVLRSFGPTIAAAGRTLQFRRLGTAAALAMFLAAGLLGGAGAVQAQDPPAAAQAGQVNINKADADTLASALRGIGSARAMEIVRYRETYGPFTSVDELAEVKGIGKATLDDNRAVITLE